MTRMPLATAALAGILVLSLGCRSAANSDAGGARADSPGFEPAMNDTTSFRASGTIRSVNIEGGCWRFDAQDGKHYEIASASAPAGFLTDGKAATLTLRLRPDLMSTCMIGPIVEIVKVEP
jgi:hypothetical protein